MGVDQAHGAVGGSTAMDPDSGDSEAEKPVESTRRKRREKRKHKTTGEKKDS